MILQKTMYLFAVVLMVISNAIYGSHPQQHQVVDGLAVYLTIMPAEMLRGHPKEHPESVMHSQSRIEDSNQHHIMVSVFDANTGLRLDNATVKASVRGENFKGPDRKLELMVMGGTRSYGNYFNIPLNGTYHIELEIQQEGSKKSILVVFQYASI